MTTRSRTLQAKKSLIKIISDCEFRQYERLVQQHKLSKFRSNDGQVSKLPELRVDNATSDRLPLAYTSSSLSVVRHALLEEESDSGVRQYTLHHTESLQIVTSSNPQDVSLKQCLSNT